jgi:hypothetical protein
MLVLKDREKLLDKKELKLSNKLCRIFQRKNIMAIEKLKTFLGYQEVLSTESLAHSCLLLMSMEKMRDKSSILASILKIGLKKCM